ncbi:hypothetical protein LXA43DRAFT_1102738 [Ganoderma leucocontextum]|nr:hypothetical protein LXA43DRAFT_1102738 [Ganoderma leucocontextum]
MSTQAAPVRCRAAMSTGGKAPRKLPPCPLTDSEDDIIQDGGSPPSAAPTTTQGWGGGREDDNDSIQDGDSPPLAASTTRGRGRGRARARARGRGAASMCTTRATKKAPVKAESDGDDPVEVKTSKDVVEDDVVLPVKRGRGRPAKTVKSPEVVPSEDDEEPVVRKTKSSSKPRVVKKESIDDDEESAQKTIQKTPPTRVMKDKQPAFAKTRTQAPVSIDSEADACRPDSCPSVMRTPKVTRVREDEEDVVSPESLSPRHSSSEDDDEEEAHASLTKKQRQYSRSPELEYKPTPKVPKNALWAVGFGQAEVVITTKAKRFKPVPIGTKINKRNQEDKSQTAPKVSKAPDSASDFFNTSPTMVPRNGKGLFFDEESFVDMDVGENTGNYESDNSQEDSPSHMLTSNDDDDIVEYVASKKTNKPRAPTPGTDLEDTAAMQMNEMSLLTPQKGRKQATSKKGKEGLRCYPPPTDLVDLKKHSEHAKHLPVLNPVDIDFGSYPFWTRDVYPTVLDVMNYKMHLVGLIYALNLSGLYDQGVINPARSDPNTVTMITGSPTTQRLLAVLHRTGPRRAITFTIGIVLKCNIRKDTPSFNGSTQWVRQIILAPFQQEWLRMSQFFGTVFDVTKLKVSIFGPIVDGVIMNSLIFKTRPSARENSSSLVTSGFTLTPSRSAGGPMGRPGARPDQSFEAMSLMVSWSTDTHIPIWDARTQFRRDKYILDGLFTLENTFNLPKYEGNKLDRQDKGDLQHGDIALVYYNPSTFLHKKDGVESTGLGLSLYGVILMGRPNEIEDPKASKA